MPYASEKKLKKCHYCGKEVRNLGFHIVNLHPKVFEQIDDNPSNSEKLEEDRKTPTPPLSNSSNTPAFQNRGYSSSSISEMVKEKLDTMLNIKIIQMIEKGASLQEIQSMMQPPPAQSNISIDDLKKYHDIVFQAQSTPSVSIPDESGGMVELLTAAMPLIGDLLKKREVQQQNDRLSPNQTGNNNSNRTIQPPVTGNTAESSIPSEEPGGTIQAERQDNRIVAITDKRLN